MNRRVASAVSALVLAAIGTFALVAFVSGAEDRAVAGEKLVNVLVLKDRVEAGTPAKQIADSVKLEKVPAKVRADDAVTSLKPLEGKVASVDLLPGEQLTRLRFVEPDVFARNRAAVDVPKDHLEVTISLEPQRALGGILRPGSSVAVIASFDPFEITSTQPLAFEGFELPGEGGKTPNSTHLILHKKTVTNIQADTAFDAEQEEDSATAPAPTGNLLVTLALLPDEVERVVFAAEHGTLWLALQPASASETGTQVITRANVYE